MSFNINCFFPKKIKCGLQNLKCIFFNFRHITLWIDIYYLRTIIILGLRVYVQKTEASVWVKINTQFVTWNMNYISPYVLVIQV